MSKTLVNLRDDVETRLGDTGNTVWSEAELTSYIKEGYDELCLSTEILWKRSTTAITDVAGTGTYSLPSDFYKMDRVTWQNRKIEPWTAKEARQTTPYYRTTRGNVIAYVMEMDGLQTIRLINVPSASGSYTVIEYFRRGATLSADGTALDIPDRYTDYVVWYALARALERDGKGQDSEMAAHYNSRYLDGLARIKKRKSQVLSSRTGVMGGGSEPPRGPGVPTLVQTYGRPVRVRY